MKFSNRPPPVKKIDALRELMAKEDWVGALRLAASFGSLGEQKARIMRAWEAIQRPDFQRQLGRDPAALLADGVAALKERYPEKKGKGEGCGSDSRERAARGSRSSRSTSPRSSGSR